MKIAIYPGSFNPFHLGHREVVEKALQVFDRVIVAKGINPAKANKQCPWNVKLPPGAEYIEFTGLTATLAKKLGACALIKGIRNAQDLEEERAQQYYNKTRFGLEIPTFFVLSSNDLMSVSSTAERAIMKFKKGSSK
jgi:pantetheine-phosphate adenylyltransferase